MAGDRTNILICDDDPDILKQMIALFDSEHWSIVAVEHGGDALRQLQSGQVDILLLDLMMPDVDGLAVLDVAGRSYPQCSVLMISAVDDLASVVECIRRGAEDFIPKPLHAEELVHRVQLAKERRQLRASNENVQRRLERSESINRQLMEAHPDSVIVTDSKGQVLYSNLSAATAFGDALAPQCRVSDCCSPGDRTIFDEFVGRVLSDGATQTAQFLRGSADAQMDEWTAMPVDPQELGLTEPETISIAPAKGIYFVVRDITASVEAELTIEHQATHDALTGLPNRSLFHDRLEQMHWRAQETNEQFAVALLDVDRFRRVNASLGMRVADQLLNKIAHRLLAHLRDGDTLARVGGDEFALLLPNISGAGLAAELMQGLVDSLSEDFQVGTENLCISASVGVGIYPQDGCTIEELNEHAALALQNAKQNSRGKVRRFTEELEPKSNDFNLESDLRRLLTTEHPMHLSIAAISEQLRLFYQPQVDLSRGCLSGLEALVRWNHPSKGLIPAMDFIPMAEESGLIIPIGEWVLRQACNDAAVLIQSSKEYVSGMTVSVNISAAQLVQENFEQIVTSALEESGLAPTSLELEITEHVIVQDIDAVTPLLRRLSRMGVRIAIDDFGTGYSSLGYLQSLPLDTIKIDRSFVQDLENQQSDTIVDAVISIAKNLNLQLISEGVETWGQLQYLRKNGCDKAQGFLFAKPCSLLELRRLLDCGIPALQQLNSSATSQMMAAEALPISAVNR